MDNAKRWDGPLVILFLAALMCPVAAGRVIYVDADAEGLNNGSTWANAFTSLQDALAAATGTDEVLVARGVYYPDRGAGITPGDRSATFQLKSAVDVRGGYAGYDAPNPEERDIKAYETILTGDLAQNDSPNFGNYSENSYHVVTGPAGSTTALLEGVTITAGNADGSYPKNRGGGILLDRSNKPAIVACTLRYNRASDSGGGLYMKDSSATLERCTFARNKADGWVGGGMFLRDCFSTTVTRCAFTANVAPNGAGAGNSSGDASFHNCLFSGNIAQSLGGGRGGGFWHTGSPSSDMSRLINCTFGGNLATGPGPVGEGGGLSVYYGNTELYNCILWRNRDRGGADESAQIHLYSGQCAFTNCCIQGLNTSANQNISADPLLLDADGPDNIFGTADDDYRLLADSPCVNAGDNTWAGGPEALDMAGSPRIQDGTVDIGAYEGTAPGLLLDTQSIKVPEGETASFTVALSSDPKGPLTVSVNRYSGDSDITIKSGQALSFDSANFDQPQKVTVAAAEDDDFLHGRALLYVTAPGLPTAGVTVEEIDNERSTIVHVDRNAEGADDGATWADAFTSLQDALRFVRTYAQFDHIHVAQGTYRPDIGIDIAPGDRTASFQLINDITIKGGYAGAAGPDPNARDVEAYPAVLSGDLMNNDMAVGEPRDMVAAPSRSDNSYHVVTADGCGRTAVLDGFTITAGNAAGGADSQKQGGGIYGHRPTIQNCRITGNSAFYSGGGAAFLGTAHGQGAIVDNSIITDNAAKSGGGIYGCAEIVNSTISHNVATQYGGGGIYFGSSCETTVADCLIAHNTAEKYGGGATIGASESKVIFTRCTIMANSAKENGGAVSVDGCTCGSYPEFHNCTIIANEAGADGGAIFSHGYALTKLNSCILIGNSAGGHGGALCDGYSAGSMTVNCTFAANTAAGKGGAIAYIDSYTYEGHQLYNSILWANSAKAGRPQIYFVETTTPPWNGAPALAIEYCCIQNLPGDIQGSGNIKNDPRFVDIDGPDNLPGNQDDDLHLKADSPCINKGNDYWVPPDAVDLDGRPRIAEGRVDMGAYEVHGPREWFVDDVTDPHEDGSAAHPFDTIQEAIDAAAHGDTVIVMDGTYTGDGNRDIDLQKEITVRSQNGPAECVIDCQGSQAEPHRGFHIYLEQNDGDPTAIIEGFTITNGYLLTGAVFEKDGGAIACTGSAIIRNNRIIGNTAPLGGGISCRKGSPQVLGNFISENTAIDGGAVNCYERAIVKNNIITKNKANRGGGIYTWEDYPATILNNIITENWADEKGGGIAVLWDYETLIAGNVIAANATEGKGGGIYLATDPATIANNTIYGNTAGAGGGIYKEYGFDPAITNCIIWANGDDLFECSAAYSCIENQDPGQGNIHNNPLLVDPERGNYRPAPASPCIDAGDNAAVPSYLLTDAAGNPRIANAAVDMGAYEFVHVPHLVAHWKLDEIEGTTAKDSSGINDGTLHGNPLWRPSAGFVDGALEFDGQGDYVNCGASPVFDITGQITIAAWVKISSVNMDWQTIIAKGDSAWRLSTANDQRRFHFAVTGGPPWNYINGDIEVDPGEWHHVCGTYDGMNLRLYIDGVEDPAGPVPELNGVTTDHYDVLIGENQERPQRYWDGTLDDIRIYDHALSAADVAQLSKRPRIIYVDAGVRGANDGLTWKTAFYSLQDALVIAQSGDEIRVAEGLYTPDDGTTVTSFDRTATFQLIDGVTIKGGYAGFGQPDPDVRDIELYRSILSGDLLQNDAPEMANRADNSRHVVTGNETGQTAVLDGFTITAGYADGIDTPYPFINNGAGMYNEKGSPTVTHCTFTDNVAVIYDSEYGGLGAAIYNYMSSPVVHNCAFAQNLTDGWGAAVYNENSSPTITRCTFTQNDDGAVRFIGEGHPLVADCLFLANSGGAIGCSYGGSPAIQNCRFIANVTRYDGGALWCYENANPTVANCLFLANTSLRQSGGAISCLGSRPKITNCTFSENTADDEGGAVACRRDSNPELTNCIFWANNAPQGAQIGLRYDRPWPTAPLSTAGITISYSSVQGGLDAIYTNEHCRINWGIGNIDADPRFVLPGYWDANGTPDDPDDDIWIDGDYHLGSAGWRWDAASRQWTFDRLTSRCIDAGDPASSLGTEPLTVPADPNNDWGANLRINMGAYGGTPEAGIPPHDWAVLADLTNDGVVDWADFAHMAAAYTPANRPQPGDINRNG
ncbi:MAG: right-handed parallel beta-helix repeat-containing protein, partial [Phycisphaerales bacterium]